MPLPPAFNLGLFRTHARPLPATVAGAALTLPPTEKGLGGSLGFRSTERIQVAIGGCVMDATVIVTVTLHNTKGLK